MSKVKVTKVRSTIKSNKNQKLVMQSLGLKKMNSSIEHEFTPQIKGMVNKVSHLIKVEEI
jgi:large subunit ribosomal protein L30